MFGDFFGAVISLVIAGLLLFMSGVTFVALDDDKDSFAVGYKLAEVIVLAYAIFRFV